MGKGIHDYIRKRLSKLSKKKSTKAISFTTNNWLIPACNYPKTQSFAAGRQQEDLTHRAATLADVDRFLFENFNSLYADTVDEDGIWVGGSEVDNEEEDDEKWSTGSPVYADEPPTNLHLRSSHRFFTVPSVSNSLIEDARLSVDVPSTKPSDSGDGVGVPEESVAVVTFSKDPYEDFRRSMTEMVEARHRDDRSQPLDWDFMEDLLICYLELNDRKVHKYILGAFTDLTVSVRRQSQSRRLMKVHVDSKGIDCDVEHSDWLLSHVPS